MGVPKFFRYISERYPCLSELVKEYQIPEFDNLYLDMNGIVHMCSHPDDNNPHFRITEEKIFQDVFHYIEVLFRMIRPRELFFMAIDGVAPRAKMNQQRGRRFRSAKEAENMEEEAKKKGEKLPDADRFDSNCITPGTPFMARLQEQLKYFVVDKISTEPLWQKCKVILSGHETPGEGEHKIMDYIRFMRAQPGYNPNMRHCLYGLDADLIMLGLCTHDPHFSLLREEVKFGKKSTKRISSPEEITFYLLHLSLMREYLELEFAPLKEKLIGFNYDFEKVIDDWVLMGFLVGNDFIPHLPNLHISEGALPILYKAYMEVLPTLDGYINEGGRLNLERFEKFMQNLSKIDYQNFEAVSDDILYMEAKTGRKHNPHVKVSTKPKELQTWDSLDDAQTAFLGSLEPEKSMDRDLAALIQEAEDLALASPDEPELDMFEMYKNEYYRCKMEFHKVTPDVLRSQAEGYVRAIQWNLNYYYNGCCSWSWYYPHHYAPYISDITGFTNLKLEYDLGRPFKPYEQLLAVQPAASKELLPRCYHRLMTEDNSPIQKYYPVQFETDLNGKKQEWEAVVLIPFIDENMLLEAMKQCNDELSPEEVKRNTHGPMTVFTYSPEDFGVYKAPQYFATIPHNHAKVELLSIEDVRVPVDKLVKGAYPGVKLDVYYAGFPTMKHLKYKARLEKAQIRVFESNSRFENTLITIIPDPKWDITPLPIHLLGKTVFVRWPHLIEAKVIGVANAKEKYKLTNDGSQVNEAFTEEQFNWELQGVVDYYKSRMGIICGTTKVFVVVQTMIGRRYVFTPNGRVTLEKQFTDVPSRYPLQTIVSDIKSHEDAVAAFTDVQSLFPVGSTAFSLTNPYYGCEGQIVDSVESLKNGRIRICCKIVDEPDLTPIKKLEECLQNGYKSLFNVASQLAMSNLLFSKITGTILLSARNNEGGIKNVPVGLDLKFTKRNKETPGYTKKSGGTWYYTDKTVALVAEYMEKFPEVFDYFVKHEKQLDNIRVEDVLGEDYEDRLKALQLWLKNIPTATIEKRCCGSKVLEQELVDEIAKIVDASFTTTYKEITMQIKPSFLYRSDVQNGTLVPDPKMDVKVLDRVVNVRPGFTVPMGLKGTVISIIETNGDSNRDLLYDVLFDESFKDGMALSGGEERGYRLPNTAFINLSYGKRLMEQKAGKPADFILKVKAAQQEKERPWRGGGNGQQNAGVPQEKEKNWRSCNGQQNSAFASFSNNFEQQQKSHGQRQRAQRSQNASAPPIKTGAGNMFMPQFHKGGGDTAQNVPQVKIMERSKQDKQKGDTDMSETLKSILKIDTKPPAKMTTPTKAPPGGAAKSSSAAATSSKNVLHNMFTKVAQAPATVRLLTYYQSNNLGLPLYQYFSTNNLIQAKLTLNNNETIFGEPAPDKIAASENVAGVALEKLLKKNMGEPGLMANALPVPPQNWVQPETKSRPGANQRRAAGKSNSAVLNNSFVPLQVMKSKYKADNKKQNEQNKPKNGKASEANASGVGTEPKQSINATKKTEGTTNQQTNPPRKPRIAANFVGK